MKYKLHLHRLVTDSIIKQIKYMMTASQCEVLRGKLNGRFKKSIKDIEICTQKSGIDTQDQSQQGNVPCP